MRKSIIGAESPTGASETTEWLELEAIASVEVSSEAPAFPIENALVEKNGSGWKAAKEGTQIIRLVFDSARTLRQIRLRFVEEEIERAQEFVLRWATGLSEPKKEIVRQQFHFSPSGARKEIEDYQVELKDVRLLELEIIPDRSGGSARASLAELKLA